MIAAVLDRDLDGSIDYAGAAVLDTAWPLRARAVMRPVLGDLVDRLAALHVASDDANTQGSAYLAGWYGYVDKDLRALLRRPVRSAYSTAYCGGGELDACRASLWAAMAQAVDALAAKQGFEPSTFRP